MIQRNALEHQVQTALRRSRVVALIGPRQCGKTSLARRIVPVSSPNYFDLEDPVSLARLDQPMTALADLRGLIVIDEIQRRPELFPVLRVLTDRKPLRARFLILGSASPDLMRQSSESLAGRLETIEMGGLTLKEVGAEMLSRHWLRGGLPLSFLAPSEAASFAWRKNFIQTFVERDLPQWGIGVPSALLQRFWKMLAHYHGQVWNGADPARSLGVSEHTIRRYLDILTGVFMVRQLEPWHANLSKRQVKAPKIYFRDSGLLHQLMGIGSRSELLVHPKSGASWEGYALEEVIRVLRPEEVYFWATHAGAELDLLLIKNGKKYGVEFKRSDAPRLTPSMRIAMEDLKLAKLAVIYPGARAYSLQKNIRAVPLKAGLMEGMHALFQ